MTILTPKTLSNEELMDKLRFCRLEDGERAFICDLCGAWAKQINLIRHEKRCPDKGVQHGD